jgi:hypothetical protein
LGDTGGWLAAVAIAGGPLFASRQRLGDPLIDPIPGGLLLGALHPEAVPQRTLATRGTRSRSSEPDANMGGEKKRGELSACWVGDSARVGSTGSGSGRGETVCA